MNDKYTEIYVLKELLEQAEIPYQFSSRPFEGLPHIQIVYPNSENRRVSVIQGYGTYGAEKNLLEIMGLLTEAEQGHRSEVGWLSAENVFDRIAADYEKCKQIGG